MTAPTAEPLTVLDAETVEECWPPCDARYIDTGKPCGQPAQYIAVVTCPEAVVRHRLYCEHDLAIAVAGRLFCTPHHEEHYAELLSWGELR